MLAPRKPGVICGLAVAEAAFRAVDPNVTFEYLAADGDEITTPRTPVARISGDARAILTAERTALNFISHMSGVATSTAKLVALTKHTKAKVICTRKTTPNLRALEKYAVRCGGGMNHRFGLDDAVLIKDNHIAVCGGIRQALQAAKAYAGHMVKIEIEVDNLEQLKEVIAEGADIVLFDNMSPHDMRKGVEMIAGRMKTEASGGISAESAKAVAESGVDMLSSGALDAFGADPRHRARYRNPVRPHAEAETKNGGPAAAVCVSLSPGSGLPGEPLFHLRLDAVLLHFLQPDRMDLGILILVLVLVAAFLDRRRHRALLARLDAEQRAALRRR